MTQKTIPMSIKLNLLRSTGILILHSGEKIFFLFLKFSTEIEKYLKDQH
jgi:hypothetical protein